MLKAIVFLLGVVCSPVLLAQPNLYHFEGIDVKNGLSANQVNSIVKDEKGFIWFGTIAGLDRYDGYNFKIFKHKIGDSTTLSDDYISQVIPGPYHTLWVLTRNGWNIFDRQTERFTSRLGNILGLLNLPDESFTSITQDGQKNYWFVYPGKGLFKFNSTSGKTVFYNNRSNCSLYSNNVTAITQDHEGFTWIIYSDGMIEKMDTEGYKILERIDLLHKFSADQNLNYKLFADADNDL